jgi:hypothetical protein
LSSDRSATFKQLFGDKPLSLSGFVDSTSPLVEPQSAPVEGRLTPSHTCFTGPALKPKTVGDL